MVAEKVGGELFTECHFREITGAACLVQTEGFGGED